MKSIYMYSLSHSDIIQSTYFYCCHFCELHQNMTMSTFSVSSLNLSSLALQTPANDSNNTNPRDCNSISTGAILLADIIPSLLVKLLAPFMFPHVQ